MMVIYTVITTARYIRKLRNFCLNYSVNSQPTTLDAVTVSRSNVKTTI